MWNWFLSKLLKRRIEKNPDAYMTDLGKEVLDVLQTPASEWQADTHTLDHKPTGLKLWTSSGASNFRIWRLDGWDPGDVGKTWFSTADKIVLWRHCHRVIFEIKEGPKREALDRVRLARIKGGTP
jgi:hypothetical protein